MFDDVVGELVEKLRKGQALTLQGLKPIPKQNTDRWSVPIYDFGYLLDGNSADYIGDEREALAIAGSRAVPPPRLDSSFVVVIRDGRRVSVWLALPDGSAEPYMRLQSNYGEKWVFDEGGSVPASLSFDFPSISSWLLLNKAVRYEMAEDTIARQSINAGRLKGGRKPLEAVRVVHLNKVIKLGEGEPKPHQGGSHRSPVPHDRAPEGYSRTYKKTGLTKWYPGPIKVMGGKEAAGPESYKVVNN